MTIANLAFTQVDTYLLLTAQVYFFVLNVHCIIFRLVVNEMTIANLAFTQVDNCTSLLFCVKRTLHYDIGTLRKREQ